MSLGPTPSARSRRPQGRHGAPRPATGRPSWHLVNALVLATSLQLTLLAAGIGAISAVNSRRSLETLAGALGRSISQQVRQELDTLLQAPRLLTQLNGRAIESGQLDPENFPELERTFLAQMRLFPVGYINYGNEQGEYLGIERLDNGALRLNLMETSLGPRRQLVYDLGPAGRGPRPVLVYNDIGSAREEAWYRETVQRGRATWSSIYQWDDKPQVLSISYNQPVRDPRGGLQGVIGVDLILSQLNGKLRNIWGDRPGTVLIVEGNGLLVASSDGRTLSSGAAGATPRRLRLDQSPDPMVRRAGSLLLTQARSSHLLTRPQRLNDADTYIEVIPWADRHGLDWLVLVLIPRQALAAGLLPQSWLPLLLYLLALSLAILVSARLTRWILRPLQQVSEAASQLADAVRRSPGESLSFRVEMPKGSAEEIQSLGRAILTLVSSVNGLLSAQRRSSLRLQREVQQKERALQLSLQSQQQSEASSEAHQRYLAHLNQEIRAPLGFVEGTTRLALGQAMPEPMRAHLVGIGDAARRMLDLLDAAVDLPASLPDDAELQESPFSLALLLQDVSDLVAQQAQLKNLELAFTVDPGSVDALVGDLRRLRQALLQVLIGAIRRAERGAITVTAATATGCHGDAAGHGDDRRSRLLITVRGGEDPLALAISRALLEEAGGAVEMVTESGGCTAVILRLPLQVSIPPGRVPSPLPHPPAGPVRLVGEAARAEAERLGPLLAPLGLAPAEAPAAGGWALALVGADETVDASVQRVRGLRAELGPAVPIALLVRRLDRAAFDSAPTPPWDALVELPLHGPRLEAELVPLLGGQPGSGSVSAAAGDRQPQNVGPYSGDAHRGGSL